MDIFLLLFTRLIPLYLIIGLGYIAGKKLHAEKETIAALLIYILAPVVVFDGVVYLRIPSRSRHTLKQSRRRHRLPSF